MIVEPISRDAMPAEANLSTLNAIAIQPCEIAARAVLISNHPLAKEALNARLLALRKWLKSQNQHERFDAGALAEATARFELSNGNGIGFEANGFLDTVRFIEDLPW